jgi:hypothetical protein
MNRFILDTNPQVAAQMHCDKHVVKMILEETQMLSTTHRILDGKEYIETGKRKIRRWRLNDDREYVLYKATHVNHPCTLWSMMSHRNYIWGFNLLEALHSEYTHRYKKVHASFRIMDFLVNPPSLIKLGAQTPFPQCMPDDAKNVDSIQAYRKYYIMYKKHFARWTNRDVPEWFGV